MKIVADTDGTFLLQLDREEMLALRLIMEIGIDTETGGGFVPEYRNQLRRTQALLTHAWFQTERRDGLLRVLNENMASYERELLSEYP